MKTYDIKPHGLPVQRVRADSIGEAQAKLVLTSTQIEWWAVVPTAKQIRKTKNLLRGI